MASSSSAFLQLRLTANQIPGSITVADSTPAASAADQGELNFAAENAVGGERWTEGQASGNVDRVFYNQYQLAASGTDAYDLLAAGGLLDLLAQAIDLDELKGWFVKCDTGQIKLVANATNGLNCFTAASEGVNLIAGSSFAMSFGAAGMDVSTNSKFNVVETSTSAVATYTIGFIGAN